MLNIIWAVMILISFFSAALTGNMDATVKALLDSGTAAVGFVISIGGIMTMWSGVMAIAEKSGLTDIFARLLSPIICFLFRSVKCGSDAEKAISMNITANFLGLANAATPLGIKAMRELDRLNGSRGAHCASDDMCMLAVLNSASVQLIPSTLIAIRSAAGAADPGEIILPIWIASAVTAVSGIAAAKICSRRRCS